MSIEAEQLGAADKKRRVALVTGAGKRLGQAIAIGLAKDGFDVAVHYHGSDAGARETVHAIEAAGGRGVPIKADLYDTEAAAKLIAEVEAAFSGLDLFVSSAANFDRVVFDEIEPSHWQRAFDLNARAPFLIAHAARDLLRAADDGNIVLITGFGVHKPYKNFAPYLLSKGALSDAARVLALELAPEVRVNAVAPGTVLPPEHMSAAEKTALKERTLLKCLGSAQAVVDAVIFFQKSKYATGTEIVVDGGASEM